jgi:hypothetical protein
LILFIIIFAILICLAGFVIFINPKFVFGYLGKNSDKAVLHILAVVIRLMLGVFLIYQSDSSRYPHVIEFIGWLSIFAAAVFAVIGRKNFRSLMSWVLSKVDTLGRVGGVLAMAFGAFLVHSFI